MNGSNPFSYNNRNPFCNDFFAHREGFGVRIYNTPTSTVPNTPRMPQGSIVAPSTIGDVTRNAATNILVNLVVGGAFRLARGAFAQKGTAAVASSSMVQNTFAVWLGNVGMLAGKLPKKIQGDFLSTVNSNFNNDAIVWIVSRQTAERLVFFMQIVIIVIGGVMIFLYVRHRLDVRERKLIEKLTRQNQTKQEEPDKKGGWSV